MNIRTVHVGWANMASLAILAAIANALADARGVDFFEIPFSREMAMEVLETRQEGR